MANELWVNHDLAKGLVDPHQLAGLTYTGSNAGDTFGVHILRNGVPSTELAGRTVTGYLIRPDQQTVVIAGAISGSDVTVTLPSEAYAYSGRCSLVIRVSNTDGVKIPVFAAYFNIGVTSTDETIDPGELIPSLEDLLAQIDAMEAATNAAQLLIANYEDRMSVAVVKSVNLYNLMSRNPGVQLYADGSEHPNANYVTTGYIPVTPGVKYYAGYWVDGDPGAWGTSGQVIGVGAFYNSDHEIITPTVAADVMRTSGATAPNGAAYFRLSINCGTVTNAYERVVISAAELPSEYVGYWTLSPEITEPIAELEAAVREIRTEEDATESRISTAVVGTVNLYDSGTRVIGARLNATNGNVGAPGSSVSYDTSDYIAVSAGTSYTIQRWGGSAWAPGANDNIAWYDGSKAYVAGQSIQNVDTVTAPVGAAYARISIRKSGGGGHVTAPTMTVFAVAAEFPTAFVPRWALSDEIARAADVEKDFRFCGYLNTLGVTLLSACTTPGWYGCPKSYLSTLYADPACDMPEEYRDIAGNNGFFLEVEKPGAGSPSAALQRITSTTGISWYRVLNGSENLSGWKRIATETSSTEPILPETVAIIGDSISTNGLYDPATNPRGNVPEVYITTEDVGVQLYAYVSYDDVANSLELDGTVTIGSTTYSGHAFTADDIGKEAVFVPASTDVGKMVGRPINQNQPSMHTWWEYASIGAGGLGFTTVPVCYGGASMSSHESSNSRYKAAHAWHDSQIRKCGLRVPGSMTRTAPDRIIIFRGVNDFSHSPYTQLTDGYGGAEWTYPETDELTSGYGFLEALALTVKKCRAAYPDAKIDLCTLPAFHRVDYTSYPTRNGLNTLPEYNTAILRAAEFLSCGVIRFDLCWTWENAVSGGYVNSNDLTHPTADGQIAMGKQAVKDMMR